MNPERRSKVVKIMQIIQIELAVKHVHAFIGFKQKHKSTLNHEKVDTIKYGIY